MAACGVDGDVGVGEALLGDADDGEVAVNAERGIVDDGAALVQHEARDDAVLLEVGDERRGGGAVVLLGVRGPQVHRARRREPALEQGLGRLVEAGEDALGVDGAARPDAPVGDVGGKRVMRPTLGIGLDHVVMRHEHDRGCRGVGSLPFEENPVGVDHRELELREGARVELAHARDEVVEGRVVGVGVFASPDGGKLEHLPEALDGLVGSAFFGCGKGVGDGGRLELCGVAGDDGRPRAQHGSDGSCPQCGFRDAHGVSPLLTCLDCSAWDYSPESPARCAPCAGNVALPHISRIWGAKTWICCEIFRVSRFEPLNCLQVPIAPVKEQ